MNRRALSCIPVLMGVVYSADMVIDGNEKLFSTVMTSARCALLTFGIIVALGGLVSCASVEREAPASATVEASSMESIETASETNVLTDAAELYRSGNTAAAIGLVSRSLEDLSGEDRVSALLLLANLYMTEGDGAAARNRLNQILEQDSGHIEARFLLAMLARSDGDVQKSQALLQEIISIYPNYAPAYVAIGEQLLAEREYSEAKESFARAVEIDAVNYFALAGLGNALIFLKEYEPAVEQLTAAIELRPNQAYAYSDRARAYIGLDKREEAIADYSKAIELQPENSFHYLDRGRLYSRGSEPEKALSDFTKALELRPGDFFVHAQRAEVYFAMGSTQQAYDEYYQVLSIRRDYHPAFLPFAILSFELEYYDRANRFFYEAWQKTPGDYCLLFASAVSQKLAGHEQEARQQLAESGRRIPSDGALWAVSRFLQNPGSDQLALQEIQKLDDEVLQTQLKFYMGVQYMLNGQAVLASRYLHDVADTQHLSLPEYRMATALTKDME